MPVESVEPGTGDDGQALGLRSLPLASVLLPLVGDSLAGLGGVEAAQQAQVPQVVGDED